MPIYLFATGIIREYLFHRDFAQGFLGEHAPVIELVHRISFADPDALDAYMSSAPLSGWLIRGREDAIGNVNEMEEWSPRLDLTEFSQKEDFQTFLGKVIDSFGVEYPGSGHTVLEMLNSVDPEQDCRGEEPDPGCHYDNPGTVYTNFLYTDGSFCRPYLEDEDDFVIIAGVNHGLFELETLFSYTIYRCSDMDGFPGFKDVDAVGSGQKYWTEAGHRFFAYKIALNCNGDPWCVDLPGGDQGMEPGERFLVTGRIYLDPVSKTGPNPGNFIPSVMMWFKK